MSVIHFRRQLDRPPAAVDVPDICVRNMKVPEDLASWLELRERAMADQSPGVRPWNEHDFRTEFVSKPWWRPTHSWVAIADASQVVGSVTLAMRDGSTRTVSVVHWLLVDPAWRRRGIARLLMQYLEQAAWHEGWREIELETHAGWVAAVAFYQSMGYEPVRDRSPR
jgi:GNAT superfamily N-acetyltransferase